MSESDWANLLPELIGCILQKLPLTDFLAARAVCVPWNRAAAAALPKPDAPWLMLPGDTDATAKFFSLSTGHAFSARLPDPPIRRRIVIGSDYGWLVTMGKQCKMHLLHPVSGVQIPLPPLTCLPIVKWSQCPDWQLFVEDIYVSATLRAVFESMRYWISRKAILAPAPRPDSYTVFLVINSTQLKLAFTRDGDEDWTCLAMPGLGNVVDVIFQKDCFYTVTSNGTVVAWEPFGRSFVPRLHTVELLKNLLLPPLDTATRSRLYLAESPAGNLILLLRLFGYHVDRYTWQRDIFEVHVLDEKESRWVLRRDIGPLALFIGVNRTLCVSTEEHPELKANCVYFTDNLEFRSPLHSGGHADVGVYDLKSGSVSRITGLDEESHLNWPPPAWLTPSLK